MIKIPGTLTQTTIEVDAKWQAEDGKVFDCRYDCEQYESKLRKEKAFSELSKAVNFIEETRISLNSGDVDSTFYIKRFETKEKYKETISALNCNLQGVSYSTTEELAGSEFPKTFVIEGSYTSYADSRDEKEYHFTEVDVFIGRLQKDINIIKANYY